jgi:hypothetical protein
MTLLGGITEAQYNYAHLVHNTIYEAKKRGQTATTVRLPRNASETDILNRRYGKRIKTWDYASGYIVLEVW